MNEIIKIVKQTGWQLFGKLVTSLSTLLIISLITRSFGEYGLGLFNLVITVISVLFLLSDLGLNIYLMPKLVSEKASDVLEKLLGLRLILVGCLLTISLIVILTWNLDNTQKISTIFGLVSIIGNSLFMTTIAYFQSKNRFDLSTISTVIGSIVSLIIIYLISTQRLFFPLILLGYSVGWLVIGFTALFIAKKYTYLYPIFNLDFIKSTLIKAFPISLTLILSVLYFKVDVFLLTRFKSLEDLGIYSLATQLFQSALVVQTFINNSFYPLMLKNLQNNIKEFWKSVLRVLLFLELIALLGFILTYLLSPSIIHLITGSSNFNNSIIVINILALSFPAYFATSVLMWILVAFKMNKELIGIYSVGLLVNIFLNWIFIPKYSYFAAAAITGISEYLILLLQIIILYKARYKINNNYEINN